MFSSLSPHSWKHGVGGSGRNNNKNKPAATVAVEKRQQSVVAVTAVEDEEPQVPMVRIGVLSRSSSTTNTTTPRTQSSIMVPPPSRVPSTRVSDLSIETIRQSLREMEVQLVIAQNTVAAETRAEYDFNDETHHSSHPLSKVSKPPHYRIKDDYDDDDDDYGDNKENDQPNSTNQDIKRVLDDLQWAEFVTFRSPKKPTHKRSKSQSGNTTALCIKSTGRNSHPERQGRSWWRKHPIDNETNHRVGQ
ncbi:unnamed protein product [Cylindrotheca closterium]|uniref:Uncharacterized protein n=1 Tax=Cylindrotheca closterium TaxID=2856 RepID=A0AAD2FTU0_9STRA|nr:unnamed protein product [Cylindrotheca closterium]